MPMRCMLHPVSLEIQKVVKCVLGVGQLHETTYLDLQKINKYTWDPNFTGFNF